MLKGFIKAELQRRAVNNTLPANFARWKSLFLQRLLTETTRLANSIVALQQHMPLSCRTALLTKQHMARRKANQLPVLVSPNGQFDITANISAVLNRVYASHKRDSLRLMLHPSLALMQNWWLHTAKTAPLEQD